MASRDLDLNLAKGELVAVLSEADTRGDRRRWLVDAGGQTLCSWVTFKQVVSNLKANRFSRCYSLAPSCGSFRFRLSRNLNVSFLKLNVAFVSGLQAEEATLRPQSWFATTSQQRSHPPLHT